MSEPIAYDPAVDVIELIQSALLEVYDPASSFPPPAGGTATIRFFAGELVTDAALPAPGCDDWPFVWVRAARRYRTKALPEPAAGADPCQWPRAITIEVGVARCVSLDEQPTWQQYDDEADTALDDSWRIELALCRAAKLLAADNHAATAGVIEPFGPEGGVVGWTAKIDIQFD